MILLSTILKILKHFEDSDSSEACFDEHKSSKHFQ